jgi:peptide deformylase
MAVDPSKLVIVKYPAKVLRTVTPPLLKITPETRLVAQRMVELMLEAEGVGLAAPQVGLPWRMFVAEIPPQDKDPRRSPNDNPPTATRGPEVYINPRFSNPLGGLEPYEEGCLSLPDIRGDVIRPPVITITATDLEGREFSRTGGGLLARCWQHETDHLDGVLIIDKMTQIFRMKNRAAIRDLERSAE